MYRGAPAVNIKRPYGNSDREGQMDEKTVAKAVALHRDMETVLQIGLCTGRFKEGLSWKLVK
jgi:hypothetical protein